MRFLVLTAASFIGLLGASGSPGALGQPAAAQQLRAPPLNARVLITTQFTTYRGVFLGVETAGNGVFWAVRTENATRNIPVSVITGWTDDRPPGNVDLRIHGSNTIGAKLAPEIARAYAEKNGLTVADTKETSPEDFEVSYTGPGSDRKFVFRFTAHGSATAFEDLLGGAADIGMASRRVNDREAGLLQPLFGNLRAAGAENVIALDGVAVIVNRDNPVSALSLDVLARIFAGDIRDWAQVGGAPGAIGVYARDDRSGTFDTFRTLVLEGNPRRALSGAAKRFTSSEDLSDAVAADPQGIGFIGFAYIRNAKALAITSSCGLRFVAEPFMVKSEEYPLSRRLYFYAPETGRTPQVNDFVAFALSDRVQPVTAAVGFIPLAFEEASVDYTTERRRNLEGPPMPPAEQRVSRSLFQELNGARRLSVTFRFHSGATNLDNRANEDVGRLAAYIRANPGMERHLTLLGFADSRGNFNDNVALSRRRASQVGEELSRRYQITVPSAQVLGFGPVSPVACNDGSDLSLEKNRRVEVWLRR
jgi:phosphate transport system substrate-binding protein